MHLIPLNPNPSRSTLHSMFHQLSANSPPCGSPMRPAMRSPHVRRSATCFIPTCHKLLILCCRTLQVPPIIVSRLWNSDLLQGLCSMSSHCALMFQGSSHPRKHYDSTRVLPRRICYGGVVAPNIVLASSDIQGSWGSYLRVLLLSVCWSCPFFQYRTT